MLPGTWSYSSSRSFSNAAIIATATHHADTTLLSQDVQPSPWTNACGARSMPVSRRFPARADRDATRSCIESLCTRRSAGQYRQERHHQYFHRHAIARRVLQNPAPTSAVSVARLYHAKAEKGRPGQDMRTCTTTETRPPCTTSCHHVIPWLGRILSPSSQPLAPFLVRRRFCLSAR